MVVYHGFHALNNAIYAINKCKKLLDVFFSQNKIILTDILFTVTSIVSASLDLDFFFLNKKWSKIYFCGNQHCQLSLKQQQQKIQVMYFLKFCESSHLVVLEFVFTVYSIQIHVIVE